MAIVVESTTSASTTSSTSLVINKPNGLSEGDLMIALLGAYNSNYTTPSGWTDEQTSFRVEAGVDVFSKIADTDDVSASNFTFVSGGSNFNAGALMRVTGFSTLDPIDTATAGGDSDGGNQVVTGEFSASVTPNANALLIMVTIASNGSTDNVVALTSYGVTGVTASFTEIFDIGANLIGDNATLIGGAYSVITTPGTITQWSTTASPGRDWWASILLTLNPKLDATASNAVFQTSPVTFATLTGSTQNATTDFNEISPEFPTQSGRGTTPTQWSNDSKPTTDWQNDI
jgi:hypothetical protein